MAVGAAGGFVAGSIVAKLLLDKTGWNKAVKEVEKDGKSLGSIAKTAGQGFLNLAKVAAGAAIAVGGAMFAIAKKTANAGDAIYDMHVRTGVATETLSAYKMAAEKSGTSIEGLAVGLRTLSMRMLDTTYGLAESQRAFADVGVQALDTDGKMRDLNEVMLDVADRFKNMEDGAQKAALAQRLFGRQGMALVQMLNQGREGLQANAELAEKLGLIWDKKAAAAADRFNDAMVELSGAFEGIRNEVGKQLIPVFTKLIDAATGGLADVRGKIAEFAESGKLQEWAIAAGKTFIWVFKHMAMAVQGLMLLLPSLKAAIFSVAQGFYDMLSKVAEGISLIPGTSAEASIALRVLAAEVGAFADIYGAAADENIEKASDIVMAFDSLFESLDNLKAGLDSTAISMMRAKTVSSEFKLTTEELDANVTKLSASLSGLEMFEFDIALPFEEAAEPIRNLGLVLGEFWDLAAKLSEDATAKSRESLEAMQALYTQVFADIINGFTAIMMSGQTMGEAFSNIVTKMIADLGKLVIAQIVASKKIIEMAKNSAIAKHIANIFAAVPFPLDIILAAGAFAAVSKLFSKLTKFAEGGFFDKPTLIPGAVVGEKGPEYILPEKKLIASIREAFSMPKFAGAPALAGVGAGAGGATVTVNMNGPLIQTTGLSRRDMEGAGEDMARIVDFHLRKRVGRG